MAETGRGKRKQPELAKDKDIAKEETNPRSTKVLRGSQEEGSNVATKAPITGEQTTDVSIFKTNTDFMASLMWTSCDQLRVPQNTVFCAERTDKIVDVFRGMIKHNFLSVPVLQKTGHKWYGFIDMADIVHYVIDVLGADKLRTSEDFWALFDKEEQFRKATVRDLMKHPVAMKNRFNPVMTGYSLFYVIECLAREPTLHRVPIIDQDRQLMNLITQSQVSSFLFGNLEKIGSKTKKPLRLCRDAIKPVVKVVESQPAIDAFTLMVQKNVSAVAVVSETGVLKGALSVRDLKCCAPDATLFWRLYQPAGTFLIKLDIEHGDKRPTSPQYCTADDDIGTALIRIVEHKIHRVFIVDDQIMPIGVFSIKDLLLEIITP
jgi:CBS domain-containing protein